MDCEYMPLGLKDTNQTAKAKAQAKAQASLKKVTAQTPSASKRKRDGECSSTHLKISLTEAGDESSTEGKASKPRRKPRLLRNPKADKDPVIIIGLDIGTTGSAVACVVGAASLDKIVVYQQWPGNTSEVKVPTRMAYAIENDFDTDQWGNGVVGRMNACFFIKLHLDENMKKADFRDRHLQQATGNALMRLPEGKEAIEVIKDFVSKMREHYMQHLGRTILEATLESTPKRIYVPVPTTWSLAAREATRQAVRDAGFGAEEQDEIAIIDESEAAALYVIKSLQASSSVETLEDNACMQVIDLGGGTMDSVLYRIVSRTPLQLEEACAGEGAKIGGTTVDRALHVLMHNHFGSAFSDLSLDKIGPGSHFMEQFEKHKRNYRGPSKGKQEYWLHLVMKKLDEQDLMVRDRYDFEDNNVKITNAEMETFFEPVVQGIFDIIRKQVDRIKENDQPITSLRVTLCGGLSCNEYVLDRVEQFAKDFFKDSGVKVQTPHGPMAAVVRGAVLAGQAKLPIICRRSREFLGTHVHTRWDPKKHRVEDRFKCPELGFRSKNQIEWLVEKGEKLKPNMKPTPTLRCYHVVKNTQRPIKKEVLQQVLFKCSDDVAPSRVDHPVEKIGTIQVDVTAIVREKRAQAKEAGRACPSHISIDVGIELNMSSDKGVLEAVAKIGRKKVGTTTITYTPAPAWEHGLARRDDDK
ncbi:uncharacterized protein Z519_06919 [Cladophialophora bantiana CBS 173.52]|uniref:Hsp70-like protein n=1 Tax=Cladophialophora bantiana (strain ATCC 10958 / CBS 173.52 / CDC B-1940 / NIH 8579) TaxID=1442370 RepID=A0A0D2FZP4_CLAB1|nr:uncharacterized protein Z519_06919 [Cladophialophora bantiana CBS 173.52]KIW91937.1 hypothetical protein Z519_06919 [Cladophialophora bantiana CBS 173.52]